MNHLTLLLVLSCVPFVFAQKTDTTFNYHYFRSGELSSKEVVLTREIVWGYAKAYDRSGKEIYSRQTRRVAGHASVSFKYYENGAVQSAHFTSHPDGGIQYSDVLHSFDEKGNVTDVRDLSTDDQGRMRLTIQPSEPMMVKEPVYKQEVMECAVIYSSEVYVVNLTGATLEIAPKKSPAGGQWFEENQKISDRDTVLLGSFIEAQQFTHPRERVEVVIVSEKKRRNAKNHQVWDQFVQESREKRRYYLLVVAL